jgi:hypothetical protein
MILVSATAPLFHSEFPPLKGSNTGSICPDALPMQHVATSQAAKQPVAERTIGFFFSVLYVTLF